MAERACVVMVWRVRRAGFFTSGVTFPSPARASITMPADKASILSWGVCDDLLTGLAGLSALAALARILGLPWLLQKYVRIKVCQRGSSDAQNLLSLIFALCTGGGHANAVDALVVSHNLS